ncbi:MAG: fibronectin type III domain-containing protein [Thermoplasmata archaeon]
MKRGDDVLRTVARVVSALVVLSFVFGVFTVSGYSVSGGHGIGPNQCLYPPCPDEPPSPPRNLQAMAGDAQVRLTWSAPLSEGGSAIWNYKIYRGQSPGTASFHVDAGNVLSYTDSAVMNDVTYYYQVTAENTQGESLRTDEVSATPTEPVTPSAPQNLQAVPGDAQVSLVWEAPASDGGSAITQYRIYRDTAPGAATFLVEVGSVLAYADTAAANDQMYYYQVAAVNAVGEGPRSNEASATPRAGLVDTASPTIVITSPTQGEGLGSTSVAVSGTASDDVAVQKVELGTDRANWVPAIGTTSWSGTLTLAEGQNTIHARAVDTSGNMATATVTVTVTLQEEVRPTPDTMTLAIVAIVGGAGAVGGVAAILLARRRRLRGGEEREKT